MFHCFLRCHVCFSNSKHAHHASYRSPPHNTNFFWSLTKKSVQRKGKFDEKLFQTKLLSRLSHKICRLFSSPVLLRKFTKNGCKGDWRGGRLREEVPTHLLFGRQFVAGHLSVSSVLSLNVIVPRSLAH